MRIQIDSDRSRRRLRGDALAPERSDADDYGAARVPSDGIVPAGTRTIP
jgi:hypothetical protein